MLFCTLHGKCKTSVFNRLLVWSARPTHHSGKSYSESLQYSGKCDDDDDDDDDDDTALQGLK